ncbi:hypothetical protein GCM10023195_24350 [Actinoallomurus liliacearum]|uniref:non-specific serine/threonine protein kinase n=1 Tax=Actinoallomurus liliacearum TaxID=1080073 RepID=A0ABP8TF32_9ACTN
MQEDAGLHRGLVLAGRYRLEDPLGRGAMGEVWRGVDLRLRRPVAVKFLPAHLLSDQHAVARFRREAEIAAGLQHPGITVMFDIERHDHLLFLVMELLQGSDLSSVLAGHTGGLPVDQVIALGVQIADALAAAHARGVVHRDIKPANLFLQNDGRVKICDFGIARLADATTVTGTGVSIGTPRYMAPEQFEGRQVDHRTDLYSFGCVLYELLTGGPVFADTAGVASAMYQHVSRSPVPPRSIRPEIPDHLDGLVRALLAKDPAHRPANATAVAELLRRPAGGAGEAGGQSSDIGFAPTLSPPAAPSGAGPAGAATATQVDAPRSRKRRTGPVVAVGIVVAALVAGGAFFLVKGSGSRQHPAHAQGRTGTTRAPAPVTGPVVPGWRLVRSPEHGVAYDVPPGWHVQLSSTTLGYADASGNTSQVMNGTAELPHPGCTGADLNYHAQTGLTGGKGVAAVSALSAAQSYQLTGIAGRTANQWANGEYTTAAGRVPSVVEGNDRTATLRGSQAIESTATATTKGARKRCEPPGGVVHAVAMPAAQGAPIVFIAIADQGAGQVADAELQKIIGSVRPLG